eukprot:1136355-Pelagomonas_calceolata.AAC.4
MEVEACTKSKQFLLPINYNLQKHAERQTSNPEKCRGYTGTEQVYPLHYKRRQHLLQSLTSSSSTAVDSKPAAVNCSQTLPRSSGVHVYPHSPPSNTPQTPDACLNALLYIFRTAGERGSMNSLRRSTSLSLGM